MMNTMIGASIFAVLTFSFPVANGNMALAQTAQDRVLTIGKPEEVGMSKSVLNAATSLYSESVARGDILGVVLLVARRGKVVVYEAMGVRDKERNLSAVPRTRVGNSSGK
jgi:hypothetical protein